MRLRTLLAFTFAFLGVCMTLAGALAVQHLTVGRLRERIGGEMADIAGQARTLLDRSMHARLRDMKVLAEVAQTTALSAAERRTWAESMQRTYPTYAWIGFADRNGTVTASTNGLLEGADVSARPWFQAGLKEVTAGDLHEAVLLAKKLPPSPNGDPLRFVDVSAPLLNQEGTLVGVVGAHLSWVWAGELTGSVLNSVRRRHPGLDVFVLAADGTVILGPRDFQGEKLPDPTAAALKRLGPDTLESHAQETWPDGREYLTGASKSVGYGDFGGLGWTVLVRKDAVEGLAPALRLRTDILTGGAFLAVAFALIGIWVADRLAKPLITLAQATQALFRSDAGTGLPAVTGYAEVRTLATSLDALLARLADRDAALLASKQDLEQRVEDRTRDLAKSNAFVRSILDSSPDCVKVLYLSGEVEYVNAGGIHLLEIDENPTDLLGTRFCDLWSGLDKERVRQAVSTAAQGHSSNLVAFRPTAKGNPRWWDISLTSIPGTSGQPERVLVLSRDITELKKTEEALRQNEARNRQVLNTAHDAFVAIDASGSITAWNAAAEVMFGWSAGEAIGRPLAETIIPPHLREAHALGLQRHLSSGVGKVIGKRLELTAVRRDDTEFPSEISISATEVGGAFTFNAFIQDITARKAREAAIEESESRYRLLAENATDIILVRNPDGERAYVSPACQTMLGYTPEEFRALPLEELVHGDDLDRVEALLGSVAADGVQVTSVHRAQHKSGRWVWVEAVYQRVGGSGGSVLAAIRDVTERHRQADELRVANETMELLLAEAQKASQSKSDFLASMSHEIRTPLNSILGFTNLLLENSGLNAQDRRKLELVNNSGAALLTVVNDVLDFSKIEAGQVELDPQSFSVPTLIDNTVSIMHGIAGKKEIEIRADIDPDLPPFVIGDSNRLRQVLLNLTNNAVKFTAVGHVELTVRREASTERGIRLRFSVSDTGIGIPEDKIGRLFDRFSQVDNSISRRFGGTGLGLAISKRLIELMGGEIGVESREGEGSSFWFTLELPVGAPVQEPSTYKKARTAERARVARILLAEDLDINQELAKAVLEGAGHRVDVVSDGAEAVQAVQNATYDIVLMDVQMPVMDGIAATRRIRSLQVPRRNLPIIAMTANVLQSQINEFRQAGMNDHVGKPFNPDELLATIDRWLLAETAEPSVTRSDATGFEMLDQLKLGQLIRLMGMEKVRTLLGKLEVQLGYLPDGAETDEDRAALLTEAHKLVSAAGLLGFKSLSDMCRKVEQACRDGIPVKDLLADLQHVRSKVLAEIELTRARDDLAA